MADSKSTYIPGVCNIGQAEIRQRRMIGWVSLAVCLALWAALVYFKAPPLWRFVLFLPAMTAAIGYLQAAWHFCAKFGLGGVFNFGPNVGRTDTVEQAEYRRQDRRTAIRIISISALIGMVVAALAFFLPL